MKNVNVYIEVKSVLKSLLLQLISNRKREERFALNLITVLAKALGDDISEEVALVLTIQAAK